jgi:DNA primase
MNPKWAARLREEIEVEAQRRQPRKAPMTAETRAIQMLFGHSEYWEQLTADDHELLHSLPAPYGPLIAWLERDHAEHGPRPWAVLSHALRTDPSLGDDALAIADGDAEPNATFAEFRGNVDKILDRELRARTDALASRIAAEPGVLPLFREAFRHWEEVKVRLLAQRAEE